MKLTYWPSTRRDCEGVAAKGEDACNSSRCTMIPGFNVVMAGWLPQCQLQTLSQPLHLKSQSSVQGEEV